jgi:hypothetical protein
VSLYGTIIIIKSFEINIIYSQPVLSFTSGLGLQESRSCIMAQCPGMVRRPVARTSGLEISVTRTSVLDTHI